MYLPNHLHHGQDVTQWIFKQIKTSLDLQIFFKTDCLTKAKEPSLLYYFTCTCGENRWIHAFHKGLSAKVNANSLYKDLNSDYWFYFL